MTKTVTLIDPPSGWKYGFPKILPEDIEDKDIMKWLMENGYPEWEIKSCGNHFYCRYWNRELDENGELV